MPYIKGADRARLNGAFDLYKEGAQAQNAGELNYLFTVLAIKYLQDKGLNYQNINDIVGALDGAKAEFQRRVVGSYEDRKTVENGDVYPYSIEKKTNY